MPGVKWDKPLAFQLLLRFDFQAFSCLFPVAPSWKCCSKGRFEQEAGAESLKIPIFLMDLMDEVKAGFIYRDGSHLQNSLLISGN